jgi:hypothetical protein
MIGLITDFSETAELQWLQRFSIAYTQLFIFICQLPWSPVRMYVGSLSDSLSRTRMTRMNLGSLILLPPCIAWFFISISSETISPGWIFVALFVGESGPAFLTTLVDGMMVEFNTLFKAQITPTCNRFRLLGKALASWSGGVFLNLTRSTTMVFWAQFGLFIATLFITIKLRKNIPATHVILEDKADEEEVVEEETTASKSIRNSRSFMLFVAVVLMLPSGGNGFFYFAYGPLNMSAATIGTIESITTCVGLACTFTLEYTARLDVKMFGFIVALLFTMSHLVRVLAVSQLAVGIISDFYLYLAQSILNEIADGLMWTNYTSSSSNSAEKGSEAKMYASMISVPSMGKLIRTALDIGLTLRLKVDHNLFSNLPLLLVICYYVSFLSVVLSLTLKRTVGVESANSAVVDRSSATRMGEEEGVVVLSVLVV